MLTFRKPSILAIWRPHNDIHVALHQDRLPRRHMTLSWVAFGSIGALLGAEDGPVLRPPFGPRGFQDGPKYRLEVVLAASCGALGADARIWTITEHLGHMFPPFGAHVGGPTKLCY